MNIVNTIFIILLMLFLNGCSSKGVEVTSGQGGEAVVVGIVLYPDGNVAVGEKISLAPNDYSPVGESKKLQETTVDSSGTFALGGIDNGSFTLSARNDTSILYKANIHISEGAKEIDLGSVAFDSGFEVIVIPWWDSAAETSLLAIEGTPWIINMNTNALSPLLLPKDEITFIHSNGKSLDTLTENITESGIIGAEESLEDLRLLLDDTLTYNTLYIQITNYSEKNDYYVDWGDSTSLVKYESDIAIHTFKDGYYVIRLFAQSKADKNAISPIVEYGHTVQK